MNRPIARRLALAMLLGTSLVVAGCAGASAEPDPPQAESSPSTPATPAADCPAAPADAPTGAVDDPFSLGDPVVVECFTVVIDAVERDATDAVIAANPGAEPAAGNVFMTVTVTITRSAGGPGDPSDVQVVLAGSQSTSGEPSADLTVDPGPQSGTLEEGQSATGTYVYEMSGGASTSVEVAVGQMTPLNVLPY